MFDNFNLLFSQSISIKKFINHIEIIDNGNNAHFRNYLYTNSAIYCYY